MPSRSWGVASRVSSPVRAGVVALVLVAIVLTVLVSAPATAQPPAPEPSRPPAAPPGQPPATVAPVPGAEDPRPFRLLGSLRVEGQYNDNFDRSGEDPQEEFREILSAPVQFRFARGGSLAEVAYTPSLVHSSVTKDAQVFHLLTANGSLPLTERFTFLVGENFRRTDEPAETDPRGIRRGRTTLLENTLSTSLKYEQATWSLTPRYAYTLIRTERVAGATEPDAGTTSAGDASDVHTLGADGTRDILGRNTLTAGYDLTLGRFETANDFDGHAGRFALTRELTPRMTGSIGGSLALRDVRDGADFSISRVDVGLRREVSALYIVDARVGYGLLDVVGQRATGELFYLLSGTYTGKTVRYTGTAAQAFQETFLEAQNVGVTLTRETSSEFAYDLTDGITVVVRGRMAETTFPRPEVATSAGGQRKDVLLSGSLEAVVRLTRLLTLNAGYRHTRVDSNLRGLDYKSNVLRFELTLAFQ